MCFRAHPYHRSSCVVSLDMADDYPLRAESAWNIRISLSYLTPLLRLPSITEGTCAMTLNRTHSCGSDTQSQTPGSCRVKRLLQPEYTSYMTCATKIHLKAYILGRSRKVQSLLCNSSSLKLVRLPADYWIQAV